MSGRRLVFLGLSITSAWGNGHATTFRGLVRALAERGHSVRFLERDLPWYGAHRDLPSPPYCRAELYSGLDDLRRRFTAEVAEADAVLVGSYVPEGIEVGEWVQTTARGVTVFYDIDTPVTLARLERRDCHYLAARLIPHYDLYLTFTGGPTLQLLEEHYGSPRARPLYCAVDEELYRPRDLPRRWDMAYMGTYSRDRQPTLEALLLGPAWRLPNHRFAVAALYPESCSWPANVERFEHLAPDEHAAFYASQRLTLNVTREDMVRAGWSPSVRLFEAAACGTPILSDAWDGLEDFFTPGEEILVANKLDDVLEMLEIFDDETLLEIGARARARVLAAHTASHRAAEFESCLREVEGADREPRALGGRG